MISLIISNSLTFDAITNNLQNHNDELFIKYNHYKVLE